jgi:hypothetical protein
MRAEDLTNINTSTLQEATTDDDKHKLATCQASSKGSRPEVQTKLEETRTAEISQGITKSPEN